MNLTQTVCASSRIKDVRLLRFTDKWRDARGHYVEDKERETEVKHGYCRSISNKLTSIFDGAKKKKKTKELILLNK